MHLRLNPLDEKRYAQITETLFVFPDVLFSYLANYVPESSRSTEHYPMRRKVCIRQDTVGQYTCPIPHERNRSPSRNPTRDSHPGDPRPPFQNSRSPW